MTCAAVLERHGDGRALDLRRAFEGACAGDAREIHGRCMAPWRRNVPWTMEPLRWKRSLAGACGPAQRAAVH
eukprot:scaffold20864_cov72-Phaeocystis_antarctica.AAC.3